MDRETDIDSHVTGIRYIIVLDAEVVGILVLISGVPYVLLCGKFILQAKAVCIALLELGLLWLDV